MRMAHKEWNEHRRLLEEWGDRMNELGDRMKEGEGRLEGMIPMPSASLPRSNVVASRVGDEEWHVIDMLVEAGLFTTRSEAVAYLVCEGIRARKDLLEKVSSALDEIRRIRKEGEEYTAKLKKEIGFVEPTALGEPTPQKKTCPKCDKDLANLPKDIAVCPYCGHVLKS